MIGRYWKIPDVKYVPRDGSDRQKRHIFLTTVAFDTFATTGTCYHAFIFKLYHCYHCRCCHDAIELDLFVAHF